ncbi:unnamed protein product [Urochloa humidicola]
MGASSTSTANPFLEAHEQREQETLASAALALLLLRAAFTCTSSSAGTLADVLASPRGASFLRLLGSQPPPPTSSSTTSSRGSTPPSPPFSPPAKHNALTDGEGGNDTGAGGEGGDGERRYREDLVGEATASGAMPGGGSRRCRHPREEASSARTWRTSSPSPRFGGRRELPAQYRTDWRTPLQYIPDEKNRYCSGPGWFTGDRCR